MTATTTSSDFSPIISQKSSFTSEQSMPILNLEAKELITKSVVVYLDRAEVKRKIVFQRPEQIQLPFKMMIRINNVSPMIARDSIRVDGQSGVLILDVDYVEIPQFCNNDDGSENISFLEMETTDLEGNCAALNDQIDVLQKRLDVLDGVAKQIGKNALVSTDAVQQRRCGVQSAQQIQDQQQINGCIEGGAQQNVSMQFAPTSLFLLNEDSMKNLSSFLDYYGKTAGETRSELRQKAKELAELKERLAKSEWELNKQRGKMEYDKNKRSINLLVEILSNEEDSSIDSSIGDGHCELLLVYQVFSCTWRPSYSLRASSSGVLNSRYLSKRKMSRSSLKIKAGTSNENLPEEREDEEEENEEKREKKERREEDCSEAILLSFHGMVEQNTDEDWKDAQLILSTAQPCSANSVPCVPSLNAMLQRTVISGFRQRNHSTATARHRRMLNSHAASQEDLDAGIGSFDYNELIDAQHLQQQMRAAAIATSVHGSGSENYSIHSLEQMPSTYFPIDHPCTIPADGQPHKIDIAHIELLPTYWHECVPSRMSSAFINAKLVNCSPLPLLPGPLSVFFNNSFVSTSNLKLVLPGEEFRCLLGVDPAIKVEYKRANTSNEQFGFMTKKSLSTHEQAISLRNAKANQSVQITIREPVPKAVDDQVKIALIQPDLKTQKSECRLTKEHNLEWTVKLAPGEQRELVVKWTAEYPAQECVLFTSGNSCPSLHIAPTYGRIH
uniref:Uncharacterized protein n=1 Tax=Meloidogyne enterolobii TaxID=390850 RepID=A0A6V7VQ81_MELEN|nr:unnamed protein product [Meloidogyne enterolobii]